tara:strand:- start:317 stop:673 length:357 start_codon:yes stop_codon:yes gene_type:complete
LSVSQAALEGGVEDQAPEDEIRDHRDFQHDLPIAAQVRSQARKQDMQLPRQGIWLSSHEWHRQSREIHQHHRLHRYQTLAQANSCQLLKPHWSSTLVIRPRHATLYLCNKQPQSLQHQ